MSRRWRHNGGALPLPGGERVGVRGFGYWQTRAQDRLEYAIRILDHLIVPEAQNKITHRFQGGGSGVVSFSTLVVLPAIDLDDELAFGAQEIDDVVVDGDLSFEF